MKKKKITLQSLIRDNHGDGYIALILILMAGLILFGGLYFSISTSIDMRNVRRSVDLASEEVFAVIRERGYEHLTAGALSYISDGNKVTWTNEETAEAMSLTDDEVFGMFLAKTGGEESDLLSGSKKITVYGTSGKVKFTISDIDYTYVDSSQSANAFEVGDVNRDGAINNADILAIDDYLANPTLSPIAKADADVNRDDVVDAKDKALVQALIDYPANFKDADSDAYVTSTSRLVITLHVEVPLTFGSMDFGTSDGVYAYVIPLSFKAAG